MTNELKWYSGFAATLTLYGQRLGKHDEYSVDMRIYGFVSKSRDGWYWQMVGDSRVSGYADTEAQAISAVETAVKGQ